MMIVHVSRNSLRSTYCPSGRSSDSAIRGVSPSKWGLRIELNSTVLARAGPSIAPRTRSVSGNAARRRKGRPQPRMGFSDTLLGRTTGARTPYGVVTQGTHPSTTWWRRRRRPHGAPRSCRQTAGGDDARPGSRRPSCRLFLSRSWIPRPPRTRSSPGRGARGTGLP